METDNLFDAVQKLADGLAWAQKTTLDMEAAAQIHQEMLACLIAVCEKPEALREYWREVSATLLATDTLKSLPLLSGATPLPERDRALYREFAQAKEREIASLSGVIDRICP